MIAIEEIIAVPSSPETVWTVISDPNAVVGCIDGAELGEEFEDGSFNGRLMVKFGPLRVKFSARIYLELDEAVLRGKITAAGRDAQGGTRMKTSATFDIVGNDDGKTSTIVMKGDIELAGKLASVVEAGANVVVRRLTSEFANNLTALCAAAEPIV